MVDDFVKSPDAALRFTLRHCGVFRGHVPIPLGFRNKPPPRFLIPQCSRALPAELFTKPSNIQGICDFL
jgi:hypothetical protein